VTLELNDEDVMRAIASQFGKEHERAKYFDFLGGVFDVPVRSRDEGRQAAGLSTG
jgi:hypothetical protein